MLRVERMKSLSKIRKVLDQGELVHACDLFSEFTVPIEEEEEEVNEEIEEEEETIPVKAAEELIAQAEQSAKEILREAKEQAELLREQAYEEGRARGEAEGVQKAYEEHRQILNKELRGLQRNVADVVQSVTREKEYIMEKYIDELKNIVLVIAEKIIQTSIHSSGEIIKRMILSATDKMKRRQWAKIYITKCNTGISMEADEEFLESLSRLSENVKIIMMENSEEGTCIIELPDEIVDASVSTQLENIKDVLNNARL